MDGAHARPKEAVLQELAVEAERGLSEAEVMRRRARFGPNRLSLADKRSLWAILRAQLTSLIVYLLAAAALLSFVLGDWAEGAAIAVVLVINTAIGFFTEMRAVRSMEALRRLAKIHASVRRDGVERWLSADDIVPGDIVVLKAGDVVPADLRLVESAALTCDESMLTGESVPVDKATEPVAENAPLAERASMVFKGTAVTRGLGLGVVVGTGMASELGRIAALAEVAEDEASPLEKRLDRLGGQVIWLTLALTAFIGLAGIFGGQDWAVMLKTAVALAVAAVPEGLPIVATVALARGMWRMARRNALIETLSAVETLGATTVILTDKTGTLTQNRMAVVRLALADGDVRLASMKPGAKPIFTLDGEPVAGEALPQGLRAALRAATLCNEARLPREGEAQEAALGDPMEVALLRAGAAAGLDRPGLLQELPEAREEAFSQETRMMATFHGEAGTYLLAVKGAPEAVIAASDRLLTPAGETPLDEAGRRAWLARNEELTGEGLRVLGVAQRRAASSQEEPYTGLTLIGLVGLLDPPRPDVAEALADCRRAGVRVVMLTGDHAGTAKAVAREIGLPGHESQPVEAGALAALENLGEDERRRILHTAIFARVSPEMKLNIVALHQASGEVVAMTGDGVNDAPALRQADIGIAMGQRGTEVAREAADMVLRDDAFPSIVAAMRQGRIIFGNIRKFVVYLMSCNLSEIAIIGVATLAGLPLPLLPLQILFLNLVTDVFPAFALGVGEGDPNAMRRPPRDPSEPILGRRRWISIALFAAIITVTTLGAFLLALTVFARSEEEALTISFLTLAFAQLLHVFNMREADAGFFSNEVTSNPFVWGALALCAALIGAAVYLPGLAGLLGMTEPDAAGWMLVFGASLTPLILGQIVVTLSPAWAATPRRPAASPAERH
ncbi:cation-translocating P-type ATPase [Afifella pfennigii]|uniref:cation-translocating P-type ATPase n=1 Tax=Afifella pfennigii TaxID=209897 RepID=UPI00047C8584|nr:cation-transporting P-type ATPase [Afifella pfennigii]